MSELKAYTEDELAEHQHLYDEVFTPVWESEGQYCRAGGGQYEKSFAWWAFKHQQSKVDELQKQLIDQGQRFNEQVQRVKDLEHKNGELQKRVDELDRDRKSYKIQRDEYAEKLTKMGIDFDRFKSGVNDMKDRMEKALAILQHTKFSWSKIKKIEQALKGGEDANQ